MNPILYAVPAFALLALIEVAVSLRRGDGRYERRDSLANIALGVGNLVVNAGYKLILFAALLLAYQLSPLRIPMSAWWAWALLFVAEDLCYYVFHRTSHRSRLWWASHVVHHSSERYNLTTAVRQTWTGGLLGWIFWVPLALVGFPPGAIALQRAFNLIYQFWIHTQYVRRLGPLELVLNTPSHHRVHHGRNARYIDKNYAGTLIVWDRLFGTFEPESEPVEYGITKPVRSHHPVAIALGEWRELFGDLRRARSWREVLAHVFREPAWRPRR